MNADATTLAPSPLWVRLLRTSMCLAIAAAVGWRGHVYDDPLNGSVTPFVMCELTAAVLCIVGLMSLDTTREPGPA